MTPNGDQRAIGALAREIAAREIAPHVADWDRRHHFPRELYATLGAAGLMGVLVPEAYGGAGADYVSYALTIEEIARVDAGAATTLSVHSMICNAIAKLGNDEQRERWLGRLATGEALAGFALTEPDAGSDAAAIRSRAVRDGDFYVLDGRKQWCTNGGSLITSAFTSCAANLGFLTMPRHVGARAHHRQPPAAGASGRSVEIGSGTDRRRGPTLSRPALAQLRARLPRAARRRGSAA